MYKVLVVDDERIIREGITKVIPWEKYGFCIGGAAENGLQALEMITADPPRVVITDVKMPGMDGLKLIAKTHAAFPEIRFIVLSGYGEFDLAKEAMHYGVKYYLLKPCNENRIIDILLELSQELQSEEEQEAKVRNNQERLQHVLPLVKEQFIRDYISGRHYTQEEYTYYCNLLEIGTIPFVMVLAEPVGKYGLSELVGLMNIVDQVYGEDKHLGTIIKNQFLVLRFAGDMGLWNGRLQQIQERFRQNYQLEVNLAYSDAFLFEQAPVVFQELGECLKHALYLGSGSLITPRDLGGDRELASDQEIFFNFDTLAVAVKSGDSATLKTELQAFFQQLRSREYGPGLWKTYATELLMILIRQANADKLNMHLDKVMELQKLSGCDEIEQFITGVGNEITRNNYEGIRNKHHKIINTLLAYIRENLDNEELSLKWLACEVAYMNEGYLSKLFLKETGEKFSHYLTRVRMEKAKEMMENNGGDRIYEVAQSVGLGNNPQYFSQLFKKYTGYSPTEYKKAQ